MCYGDFAKLLHVSIFAIPANRSDLLAFSERTAPACPRMNTRGLSVIPRRGLIDEGSEKSPSYFSIALPRPRYQLADLLAQCQPCHIKFSAEMKA